MVKLAVLLVLVSLACRVLAGRWPWDFLRSPPGAAPVIRQARNLLGVGPDATRTEIIEAHRRLLALVHPDRGGTNSQVHEANAARDVLLANLPRES